MKLCIVRAASVEGVRRAASAFDAAFAGFVAVPSRASRDQTRIRHGCARFAAFIAGFAGFVASALWRGGWLPNFGSSITAEAHMKTYEPTTVKARIAAGALSIAIAALLLEVVAGGFIHPDPDAVTARQQVFASQAEQAARVRALMSGELRCVDAGVSPRS